MYHEKVLLASAAKSILLLASGSFTLSGVLITWVAGGIASARKIKFYRTRHTASYAGYVLKEATRLELQRHAIIADFSQSYKRNQLLNQSFVMRAEQQQQFIKSDERQPVLKRHARKMMENLNTSLNGTQPQNCYSPSYFTAAAKIGKTFACCFSVSCRFAGRK